MAVRHLEAEVRQERGRAILDLRGEINGFAQEALDAAYSEAESNDPETILLNFEEVDYINSTGIALIVGVLARARAAGISLRAYGLTQHYKEIFEITRLADYLAITTDEDSAVGGAGRNTE